MFGFSLGGAVALHLAIEHPNPDGLQGLLNKIGAFLADAPAWSDEDITGIAAPTLITVGDCDLVTLEHALRFLRLRGTSQLAVFPGTTHFFRIARTAMVHEAVTGFLDAPDHAS